VTYDLDLKISPRLGQYEHLAEYVGQRSFRSKIIVRTYKQTQWTDSIIRTTKVVGNNHRSVIRICAAPGPVTGDNVRVCVFLPSNSLFYIFMCLCVFCLSVTIDTAVLPRGRAVPIGYLYDVIVLYNTNMLMAANK